MSILTATNVGQSFGAVDVFSGISVRIANDAKIGLVGPNGIGKTSLLLVLAGLSRPTAGSVHLARGRRLGYLPQEAMEAFAGRDNTVYQEMLTAFAGLREQEARLQQMEEAMSAGEFSDELFEEYSAAQAQFELAGGYEYDVRIQQVLDGLGFQRDKWDTPLSHLSGGQKTRALLARLLLEKPDLLILDEPTNHLDIEALEWLENTLRVWQGAVVVCSHDRYFLDRVVNMVWEMSRTEIEVYRGNYSAYAQQRQERWALRQKEFEARKERLDKEMAFIKRFIGKPNQEGAGIKMAVGKLRRISDELDTPGQKISVAKAEAQLKALRRPSGDWQQMKVHFQAGSRSGKIVLRTHHLQVGYDRPLFSIDDVELHRLECAALIGPNGTGKTTFLRTILGQLEPLVGEVHLGASLKVGYFAQVHDDLDPDHTVIEELLGYRNMPVGEARNYLARYLFREDDVFKPVASLSGGERARLALAILALQGANFLLLDEPTNHLDIPAQEVLQEVLEHFEGTILLVSHDRYLVDRLATQIWALRDGRLRVFYGTYREFLMQRDAAAQAKEAAGTGKVAGPQPGRRAGPANIGNGHERRSLEADLSQLEVEIHELEVTLNALGRDLQTASEARRFDQIRSLSAEYTRTQEALDRLMAQWETQAAG